jgi:hypothetical protein
MCYLCGDTVPSPLRAGAILLTADKAIDTRYKRRKKWGEATGPRGPSERERASQQGLWVRSNHRMTPATVTILGLLRP